MGFSLGERGTYSRISYYEWELSITWKRWTHVHHHLLPFFENAEYVLCVTSVHCSNCHVLQVCWGCREHLLFGSTIQFLSLMRYLSAFPASVIFTIALKQFTWTWFRSNSNCDKSCIRESHSNHLVRIQLNCIKPTCIGMISFSAEKWNNSACWRSISGIFHFQLKYSSYRTTWSLFFFFPWIIIIWSSIDHPYQ